MTPGWILGVLLFAGSVISLYVLNKSSGSQFRLCVFYEIFDLPCPLCGGTHTFFRLIQGDLPGAFAKNPLVAAALILFTAWALLWTVLGIRLESRLTQGAILSGFLILLLANWIFVLNAR